MWLTVSQKSLLRACQELLGPGGWRAFCAMAGAWTFERGFGTAILPGATPGGDVDWGGGVSVDGRRVP